MSDKSGKIHQAVREHYVGRIKTESGCCSSDSDCCRSGHLYPVELLNTLPTGEAPVSYGCGDPVTLASLILGQVVLDLGSGAGLDCFLAAGKVGPTGRVIGVDMIPEMTERARLSAQRMKLGNVDFRLGLLEQLPVESNSVDVAISNCVINLAPDRTAVFHEAFRVLRPGGRLAASDIVTDDPLPAYVTKSLSAWAGCIAGALDIKDYRAAMESSGFVDVEVFPSYFDDGSLDEAIRDMGDTIDLRTITRESISRTVFSARITARKP